MMNNHRAQITDGLWPVMLTPFHADGSMDMDGLKTLVDWYIAQGADGLFAVCQSSEMFFLTLEERVELARAVVRFSAGRVPVLASGHISDSIEDQITELRAMADCGADGLVLVTNRMVSSAQGSTQEFLDNLTQVLAALPEDLPLGFYECPYPFKRLLTLEELRFCKESGRFFFIKDTSCDMAVISERVKLLKGSPIRLFNANTATLLDSLRAGAGGYTGVMANFHPELYHWLLTHWADCPETAENLQAVMSMCALIELKNYPACAKRYLRREAALPLEDRTRKDASQPVFHRVDDSELSQMAALCKTIMARLEALKPGDCTAR